MDFPFKTLPTPTAVKRPPEPRILRGARAEVAAVTDGSDGAWVMVAGAGDSFAMEVAGKGARRAG
jgi:hypothetical protein